MNYNPTVDYRSDRVPNTGDARKEPSSPITEIATRGALSVAVAVWAVVGFFLWIPLLLRRIVTFVVELTYVTLTDGDPEPAARRLRNAASFYRRGFVTAVGSVLGSGEGAREPGPSSLPFASSSGSAAASTASRRPQTSARPFLQELAWALILWYPVLLWVGIAELTPADVWNAAAAVPWQEIGADLVRGAVGWVEALANRLGI